MFLRSIQTVTNKKNIATNPWPRKVWNQSSTQCYFGDGDYHHKLIAMLSYNVSEGRQGNGQQGHIFGGWFNMECVESILAKELSGDSSSPHPALVPLQPFPSILHFFRFFFRCFFRFFFTDRFLLHLQLLQLLQQLLQIFSFSFRFFSFLSSFFRFFFSCLPMNPLLQVHLHNLILLFFLNLQMTYRI